MPLIEFHVDLRRVAAALESIDAHLVELIRLHSPAPATARPRKRIRVEDMVDCTPAALVERQEEDALRAELGLPKSYRDKLGRLAYPEDYPEGRPEPEEKEDARLAEKE